MVSAWMRDFGKGYVHENDPGEVVVDHGLKLLLNVIVIRHLLFGRAHETRMQLGHTVWDGVYDGFFYRNRRTYLLPPSIVELLVHLD
jgi:hypothetical protein